MENDILDFLPSYSNIHNFDLEFMNPYVNFNQSTFLKKEFNEEQISRIEIPNDEKLFKSQKFIMKFLSSYTPYDQLLIFFDMGVGKSRASISAIENILKNEKSSFEGAIIIAKGTSMLDSYKREIVEYEDSYYPENYQNLSSDVYKRRLNASLKKNYSFETFITFANLLSNYSIETIKEKYSNKIIVIDEIHNIREDLSKNTSNIWYEDKGKKTWFNPLSNTETNIKPKNINRGWIVTKDKDNRFKYTNAKSNNPPQYHHPYETNPYKEFHRLLHHVKNCKIILLSGTPMKDSFQEIASVMNLILPLNEQLPIKKDFINYFFTKNGNFYTIKDEEKKQELKSKFKGRVAYLKSISSEVKKTFVGEKMNPLKYFTVFPVKMSDEQTEVYKVAYEKDGKGKRNDDDIEDLSTQNDSDDERFETSEEDESFTQEEEEEEKDKEEDEIVIEEKGEDDNNEEDDDDEVLVTLGDKKLQRLFKMKNANHENVDITKLKITKESIYSITPWREADKISKKIKDFYNDKNDFDIIITDATSNIGGNSISFLNNGIDTVNSVEIKPTTCEILKHNIDLYGYNTLNVICDDYLKVFNSLKQDCVFFDPPWGGKEYLNNEVMDLFLSDVNVIDVIKELIEKDMASLVVLKAPKNYNEEKLKMELNNCEIIKMPLFRRDSLSYNVFFIKKGEPIVVNDKIRNVYKPRLEKSELKQVQKTLFEDGAKEKNDSSFYYHSRHSSLFVFPDGSYGDVGFKKYIKEDGGGFKFTKEMNDLLSGDDNEKKLRKLEKYSSKYATIIRKLLDSYENKKSSFVYCNSVSGGGLIVFSLLLKKFGFSQSTGSEISKKKRFALFLTGKTNFEYLKQTFNDPKNKYGEYISVVLGSRSISEGYSFKNIQEEHIITPHYNYAEIDQAIARGFRYKSHTVLINDCKQQLNELGYNFNVDNEDSDDVQEIIEACKKEKIHFPELNIYQYVSIPNDRNTPSVDLEFYRISEIKDVNIKRVERMIKESAVDCQLNKERNLIRGYDMLRECDYIDCQYQCDDYVQGKKLRLDYSSDFAYYFKNSKRYGELKSAIVDVFKKTFKIHFSILKKQFPNERSGYIIQILNDLISKKDIILNRYGIPCYLQEHNNVFFLSDNFSSQNALMEYYTRNPNIIKDSYSFEEAFNDVIKENVPGLIDKLFSIKEDDKNFESKIVNLLNKIDERYQEMLLESCIIATEQNTSENEFYRKYLLSKFFSGKYKKFENGVYISWLLYNDKLKNYDSLRYMAVMDDGWNDVDIEHNAEIIEMFENKNETKDVEQIKNNPYGYYGYYEKDKKSDAINFKIIKILKEKTTKKNKIPSGKVCSTYEMFDLIDILNAFDVKPPINIDDKKRWKQIKKMDLEELKNSLTKVKLKDKIKGMTDDKLIRKYIYWYDLDRKDICEKISEAMKEKGLIL